MLDASKKWLQAKFRQYYANPDLQVLVDCPEQREWMQTDFTGFTQRYGKFRDVSGVLAFLRSDNPPLHIYHSVAYYSDVNANDMATLKAHYVKADLLNDVDCKPGPPPLGDGYRDLNDALDHAKVFTKSHLRTLREEFRLRDDQRVLAYSGSKGYHIRLNHERFQRLDNAARRELGSILTGSGVRLKHMFPTADYKAVRFPIQMPAGGLPARVYRGLKLLPAMAQPNARTPRILEAAKKVNGSATSPPEELLDQIAAAGSIQVILDDPKQVQLAQFAYDVVKEISLPRMDLQVIGNITGQARLPGSLNGKTGLQCKVIADEDALDSFDPFVDANPWDWHTDVAITGTSSRAIRCRNGEFRVAKGETTTMPEAAAIIFLASESATLST